MPTKQALIAQSSIAGRTIAITRPIEQSDTLANAIQQAGGIPLIAPLIEIRPAPEHVLAHRAIAHLADYRLAIFISANAVQHCLPELLRNQAWPNTLQAAAVGPGTANALAQFGIDCLLPESRFDSEGLLARPELQTTAVQGQSVLLLRGDGGRELLADTLTQRGANVEAIACYARHAPANLAEPFRATWLTGTLDGILISSSEGLDNLLAGTSTAEHDKLFLTPLFVPHPRIAEKAKSAGFLNVTLTPPAEAGMLAGLLAYNWAH